MSGTINIIKEYNNIHSVSNIERDHNDNEIYIKQKNSVITELQKFNENKKQELEEEYESDFIEETQETQETQESQELQDEKETQEQESQDEHEEQQEEQQEEQEEKKYRCSYILINSLIISMIVVESIQIGVKIFSLF